MDKIEGTRLYLRTFEAKDEDTLFQLYKQPAVCMYLLHEPWTSANSAEAFQKKCVQKRLSHQTALSLAVVYDHRVIGDLSVWRTGQPDCVEIGYAFDPAYSGQGFAQEALQLLINWLFSTQQVHRIQATLDARNTPSANCCRRIGMREEAHFIQDWWNKGQWTDSLVFGLSAAEWAQK